MTRERLLRVATDRLPAERLQRLQRSAAAALGRRPTQALGDETEDYRYEQIQGEIDKLTYEALLEAPPTGPNTGQATACLTVPWPFAPGLTAPAASGPAVAPRLPWRPEQTTTDRPTAVLERFEAQLRAWTEQPTEPGAPTEPVCPSDIANRALTQGLRRYVARDKDGGPSRSAPVIYKDGSQARDLRLRCLAMGEELPTDGRLRFKVTLLSVRHMEQDVRVDGAWLRNREISLRRPAAETDQLVYEQSRSQLTQLSAREPLILDMFQTGLEPAIIGFYRAVADHHLEGSGHAVVVQPHYYEGVDRFAPGTPWVVMS